MIAETGHFLGKGVATDDTVINGKHFCLPDLKSNAMNTCSTLGVFLSRLGSFCFLDFG